MSINLEREIAALEQAEQREYDAWERGHRKLTPAVAEAYRELRGAGAQTRRKAREIVLRIESLESDDMLPEQARERLIREARHEASKLIPALRERQQAALAVIAKETQAAALPRIERDREPLARDEARMVLDGASDPRTAMVELAERGGELQAVVTGSWGESYLRARGVPKAADEHGFVRDRAIAANARHSDEAVRSAAQAHGALGELQKGATVSEHLAKAELDQAGL